MSLLNLCNNEAVIDVVSWDAVLIANCTHVFDIPVLNVLQFDANEWMTRFCG